MLVKGAPGGFWIASDSMLNRTDDENLSKFIRPSDNNQKTHVKPLVKIPFYAINIRQIIIKIMHEVDFWAILNRDEYMLATITKNKT